MPRTLLPRRARLRARGADEAHHLPSAVAALIVTCLAACSQEISTSVPAPSFASVAEQRAAVQFCTKVRADLPQTIGGASRVTAEPDSPFTAAWTRNSSFVTLRCAAKVRHIRGESLLAVDGVDWRVSSTVDTTVLTAVDRAVGIELTVPKAAGPVADYLVDLAPVVSGSAPLRR